MHNFIFKTNNCSQRGIMKKCIVKKFDFYEETNYLRIDFNIADYIKITSTL